MNGPKAITATIASAVVGGAVGYLMFTDRGRAMRRQVAPALDDFSREFTNLQTAVCRAAHTARQTWMMLNDALGSDDVAADSMSGPSAWFEGRPHVR